MIIELTNPTAKGPGDPEGMIVVAQHDTITTRKIINGEPVPYREIVPEGDFNEALTNHLTFLHAAGFREVND
jgi:hypothetical protein